MRIHFISAGIVCLLGCAAPRVVPNSAEPSLVLSDSKIEVISRTLTDVELELVLQVNAGGTQVEMHQASVELVVDGVVTREMQVPINKMLAPNVKDSVRLVQRLELAKDVAALEAISEKGGSMLVALRGNVLVTANAQQQAIAFAKSLELRSPRMPALKLSSFEAGRYNDEEVDVVFHLGVENPNPFALSLKSISYKITLAGKEITVGEIGNGEKVSPSSTAMFDVTASVNEANFGKDAKKLLASKKIPYTVWAEMKAPLRANSDDNLLVSRTEGNGTIVLKGAQP
jgi:LEA14-like dessication related protein